MENLHYKFEVFKEDIKEQGYCTDFARKNDDLIYILESIINEAMQEYYKDDHNLFKLRHAYNKTIHYYSNNSIKQLCDRIGHIYLTTYNNIRGTTLRWFRSDSRLDYNLYDYILINADTNKTVAELIVALTREYVIKYMSQVIPDGVHNTKLRVGLVEYNYALSKFDNDKFTFSNNGLNIYTTPIVDRTLNMVNPEEALINYDTIQISNMVKEKLKIYDDETDIEYTKGVSDASTVMDIVPCRRLINDARASNLNYEDLSDEVKDLYSILFNIFPYKVEASRNSQLFEDYKRKKKDELKRQYRAK